MRLKLKKGTITGGGSRSDQGIAVDYLAEFSTELESLSVGHPPLTVFEKAEIVLTLSNPDILGKVGLTYLLATYQPVLGVR